MASTVSQNRRRYESKEMQAEHTLRALQDQLRGLTELPIKTPKDYKAAAAKGKAFVNQLNNLKKALTELQARHQATLPPVFYRLHKQGDLETAKREQERVQQFCEEAKREMNTLDQQYKSWEKQVKEARKELSSVRSDGTMNSTVLMKSVSKSGCCVSSLESGEESCEKLVRSGSSKLVDDNGSLRMVLVRDEHKETVNMFDEERLGGMNGGFDVQGNCVSEEIDEQLSGRSSLVDLREREEDQRLSLEDDREKGLITGGHTSSRFQDLIDMTNDEDVASSAFVLADESRDLVNLREHDGNVMGLTSTNGEFDSCVSEECVEFPGQQKMAESFSLNDHEHGEGENNEDCGTVSEASNIGGNSEIQNLLANESRDLVLFRGDGNVMGLESTNGAFESCVNEQFGEFPSQQEMTESFGSNDHEQGEDETDEYCETDLGASNMRRNSGIQIRIRTNDHEHGEDDSNENCEMTLETSNVSGNSRIQAPRRPNDHEQGGDQSNEDCGIVSDVYNMRRNSEIQNPIRPLSRVSEGKDKVGNTDKGSKESTFENSSSTLEHITESMNPNDTKDMLSDDDEVCSSMAKPTAGTPKDNLNGVHMTLKNRTLDIQSKLREWRNEVHFDNDESSLPVWALSDMAKSEQEEIENLKECWKLRQENMNVPMKIQCIADLDRSFLDEQSRRKFHGFLAQTTPKFENKTEDLTALDAAEENIMEVASGVKPKDAMNEIVMMEDLLSHNKMLENSPNGSFQKETMELEGNKLTELEKEIEKAPTFKKFTDVHLVEVKEEDVKPALKAIRRPQSHVTCDEKVYNGKENSQLNLKTKDQTLRMNLVQSQKLAHQTIMEEPPDENLFVEDEAGSVTQCPEQRIEPSDSGRIEEAMKGNMKLYTRNSRGLIFSIQNSTNCFFPDPAFSTKAPASVPGIKIIKQSPEFKALEKRVCKIEEKQLKVERELGKKTVEKLVQSEIHNLHRAQKREKNQFFWTLVLSIFVTFLASTIYRVEKSLPPT
ncbi:hypothetical protein SUGI_0651920 [Cryptomeria japonica]|nr:hypothetical protein SUGI_0651920 [Cryptomeria japonica]